MRLLKPTVIALTAAATFYALKAAEVPALRSEVADLKIRLDHLLKENVRLGMDKFFAEWRADVMTAAALTAPTAPSIAARTADRIRAEREEELNQHGAPL